jgi:hypothetical protein
MFCHQRTAGRDSCWPWRASNAGQLPAFRDRLEPRIGRRGLGAWAGTWIAGSWCRSGCLRTIHSGIPLQAAKIVLPAARLARTRSSVPSCVSRRRCGVGHQRASAVLTRD